MKKDQENLHMTSKMKEGQISQNEAELNSTWEQRRNEKAVQETVFNREKKGFGIYS